MLTARQLLILETIIKLFTQQQEAVGSNTIAQSGNIRASSATIRNDMSVLEEKGFIQKTHFSSGRVPSLKGYRFYIDHLLEPEQISTQQLELISQSLDTHFKQMDELVHQSAQVLSELTSYTAIVLGPKLKESHLTNFHLVLITNHQVMAIMQTDENTIENMVFKVSEEVTKSDIEKLNRIFQEHLVGHLLIDVFKKMQNEIPMIIQKNVNHDHQFLTQLKEGFNKIQEEQVYISGKTNLFDMVDDISLPQLKSLFQLLDNQTADLNRLIQQIDRDIDIRIGSELNNELFHNLSLITADYHVGGIGDGVIAVIGPANMPYSKTLGVVKAFRVELANALLNYYLK